MSSSLRDQLIQAGLVTEQQAKRAMQQPRPPRQSRHAPQRPSEQQLALQRAQAEKLKRDQELDRKLKAKAERSARRAQIRQLIEQCRIGPFEHDDYFNFIDDTKVKRIAVDAQSRARLNSGELRIVRLDRGYALVPSASAARIAAIEPSAVIAAGAAAVPAGEDEHYAAFTVPDDLMW
ncbi:MAG TPA: DUF2058 domain-containing protein [Steroidobacteraceae bacterium]|nr:DUF2058 domain-containing protein [Steroidobacteraceae bacterium]